MELDVLVVGHGLAGLYCGHLLARHGCRVGIAGVGETATSLSSGCLVLDSGRPGGDVLDGLSGNLADRDQLAALLQDSVQDLSVSLEAEGLPLLGRPGETVRALNNLGTWTGLDLAPRYTYAGREGELDDFCLLGLQGHRDLDPDLMAALSGTKALWTSLPLDRADYTSMEVAQMSRVDGSLLDHLVDALSEVREELVGLPPLFFLRDYLHGMRRLERGSGRRLFEPVTPLSLPGRRLQEALEGMASRDGCRLLRKRRVGEVRLERGEALEAELVGPSRTQRVEFSCLVMATGDTVGGGLRVRDSGVEEPCAHLQVAQGEGGSPLSRTVGSGLRVRDLHPLDSKGRVVRNAVAAGSLIGEVSYPRGQGMEAVLLSAALAAREAREAIM